MLAIKTRNKLIVFILVLLISGTGVSLSFGQAALQHKDKIVKIDKSRFGVEQVPTKKIEKFRRDKDFDYTYRQKKGFDFWSYVWYWINRVLGAIFSKHGAAPYLRLLVIILAFSFIIYKIFGSNLSGVFAFNKKTKANNGFDYFDEDIHNQDLDKNLNKAISELNFRDAVRFYYLKLLKQLDINELIQWKMSKTNLDYQKELANHPILSDFIVLSGIYEYTWYGNFAIKQEHFNNWQYDFQSALKQANK